VQNCGPLIVVLVDQTSQNSGRRRERKGASVGNEVDVRGSPVATCGGLVVTMMTRRGARMLHQGYGGKSAFS